MDFENVEEVRPRAWVMGDYMLDLLPDLMPALLPTRSDHYLLARKHYPTE